MFLTGRIFKKYLGGSKNDLEKKVSYEEDFPKISLAKVSVGQKKLEFSQPRNISDQNVPRDKSRIKIIFGSEVGCRGVSGTRRN